LGEEREEIKKVFLCRVSIGKSNSEDKRKKTTNGL